MAFVSLAHVLVGQAAEGEHHGLWDPKLKGFLVVISALLLFCGSVYLLLWTNLGSSIAFLVAGAAVAGILLMMSTLWVTGQFYNAYPGRLPKWNVKEVLTVPAGTDPVQTTTESAVGKIRSIANGTVQEAPQGVAGQVKADLDADIAGQNAEQMLFTTADDYKAVKTWQVGGARKMPIWWSKKGEYAAVDICTLTVKPADYDELNNPPFVRDCDPTKPEQVITLHHDLGSQRLPGAITWAASAILLGGFLYGLYMVELRQRQQAAAAESPGVPATT